MKKSLSLIKKFSLLLSFFVLITAVVLSILVSTYFHPINFANQEKKGISYQRRLDKLLFNVSRHRYVTQRVLYGDLSSRDQAEKIQASIDSGWAELKKIHEELSESLRFTEKELHLKEKKHIQIDTVFAEWDHLKSKWHSLKPEENNDLHEHLIKDFLEMISYLGDSSNLVLDPDLDSYHLVGTVLNLLPQVYDRVQSSVTDFEVIIRRKSVSNEEISKIDGFLILMQQADLDQLSYNFNSSLAEDVNFHGRSPTLVEKLTPAHKNFVEAYTRFMSVLKKMEAGQFESPENFIQISDQALIAANAYWETAANELDTLLDSRIDDYRYLKYRAIVGSILGILLAIAVSWILLRHLARTLRNIVQVLSHASDEVSHSSEQSASTAMELSESATEQASSLQQTMASVEEISAMVSQNVDSANKTQGAVELNRQVAEQGVQSVTEMVGAIGEIKETNEEILHQMEISNKEFGEIVKIISEIGDKTNVINEIVFQTKLLSFNASVEAARAGEHGKGFAVVAEEVGNLAQMSGNAAKEITDMLSTSIKKVNEIVDSTKTKVDRLIEVGKDKVVMGQSTAEKCRGALNKIMENAQSVATMTSEITHASKEQAQGISEIQKAISQLDQVTQKNTSAAQESSSLAEKLKSEASTLFLAIQDLIAFVDGKNSQSSLVHSLEKNNTNNGSRDRSSAHSLAEKKSSKVVSIFENKNKKSSQPSSRATNQTQKVASGGGTRGADTVPQFNNPNFEDF